MGGCVDLLQHANRNVRVNLCGVEPYVPEHGLDVSNVRASFEHQSRHGMAKDVTSAALSDPRRLHVLPG